MSSRLELRGDELVLDDWIGSGWSEGPFSTRVARKQGCLMGDDDVTSVVVLRRLPPAVIDYSMHCRLHFQQLCSSPPPAILSAVASGAVAGQKPSMRLSRSVRLLLGRIHTVPWWHRWHRAADRLQARAGQSADSAMFQERGLILAPSLAARPSPCQGP
jgi:hypothetical protein